MTHLQFDHVTKSFGAVPVVETPFNLAIDRHEFVVFLGPSGCGKTTLMRMIGGLDQPTSGEIRLEGEPVGAPDRRRGMVFQSYSSFPWLTVTQNVAFGLKYRNDLSEDEKAVRAERYLDLVGLYEFSDHFPSQVSGGMRQRIAIARTLAAGADVLLMDEPFGALDALRREQLQTELRRIQRRDAKTIVFVTHDVEEALFLADRVVVFSKRPTRIVAEIDVRSRLGEERSLEIRDGEDFFALRRETIGMVRAAAGGEL
ncbi:ABC-type nitrate/sulfonate/bicarbonate transport system ATPase subunit [Methylopila capsulata]|uniref:ABC transporter ATP-binding protein n=1 Tax=Methylopila capsulata TaxID=61654 RepID=A0A9W6MSF5_9HYPH|nr:ABC transporter ATP-binding protein [Methylopila capsulata]MBM7850878.1 ABC-type nitrate/sulfonate/bicarbonate transport system ATPase subunit [Methylopila capsulata]GLK56174.1 ABC transporter ATP-binding protein [Methylopila capsulata]